MLAEMVMSRHRWVVRDLYLLPSSVMVSGSRLLTGKYFGLSELDAATPAIAIALLRKSRWPEVSA